MGELPADVAAWSEDARLLLEERIGIMLDVPAEVLARLGPDAEARARRLAEEDVRRVVARGEVRCG